MSPENDRPIAVITADTIEGAVDFLGAEADIKGFPNEVRVTFDFDKLSNGEEWKKIDEGDTIIFRRLDRFGHPRSPPLEITYRKDKICKFYGYRLIEVCWLP